MILYFTGTGNSKYVAEHIAAVTGDELTALRPRIKAGNHCPVEVTGGRLVIVSPTYAWRLPRLVEAWLRATPLTAPADAKQCPGGEGSEGGEVAAGETIVFATPSIPVYFILTCGDDMGNAAKYNQKLLADLQVSNPALTYGGSAAVVMPENYVAMYPVPGPEESAKIIAAAEPSIQAAAACIAAGSPLPAPRKNLRDRAASFFVNGPFYKFSVKNDPFFATDACIGCGMCVRQCPLNSITLVDGRPVWSGDCTHCMACICHCPAEAIEYGTASAGKPRYHID